MGEEGVVNGIVGYVTQMLGQKCVRNKGDDCPLLVPLGTLDWVGRRRNTKKVLRVT